MLHFNASKSYCLLRTTFNLITCHRHANSLAHTSAQPCLPQTRVPARPRTYSESVENMTCLGYVSCQNACTHTNAHGRASRTQLHAYFISQTGTRTHYKH